MGYFNIFYKITRIIDMLTRKRNRKAIMIILIIIAMMCLYKTKVQANESLDYNVNYYMRLSRDFNAIGEITFSNGNDSTGNYNKYCYVFPVYAGYTYNIKWSANAYANIGFQSDLSGINLTAATSYNIGTILAYTDTKDFTYTCNQDGFLFIGSSVLKDYYYPSGVIDGDLNLNITTDYDGTSNYTALHNDLLRIETLLKDYLYGDSDLYTLSPSYFGRYTLSVNSDKKYVSSNDWSLYYLKLNQGYDYSFIFSENSSNRGIVRVGYANSIPTVNGTYDQFVLNNYIDNQGTFDISNYNLNYKYIVIALAFGNLRATSTYNPGQEEGIYGGLTNVDQQVQSQGQQTRDTITSTDYTQSDVAINSDSINNVDTTQTDGLFTTIFTNFNNAATGGVDTISIPLPYNSGNLVLHSNLVSSHLGALSTLVSAFWYFVFGFYAFKFVNNLLHNIKDGSILDGFKNNNEVITQDML